MKRRSFIGLIGTVATLTAGCSSQANDGDPAATDAPTDAVNAIDNGTDTVATDTVTPSGSDSRFSDMDCPSFAESDRTVCHHTLTQSPPDVQLKPSTELFEPTADADTVETIDFVLFNRTDNSFGMNPHAWSLYERTDGEWSFVAPEVYVEPWTTVSSGETYTWQLSVQQHSGPMSEDTMTLVQDLATGVYAFQTTGVLSPESDEGTTVECIALFEVQREN